MTQFTTLELERQGQGGGIATVWMNRPEVHNAFNETLILELDAACAQLEADASVRVVVLAGRGKHFSAGADLNWMQRAASASVQDNERDAQTFARMLLRLATLSKPTIARVQGAALGGGTGLTAACDMAIAADDASFATTEVKFGIIPAVISPYVLRAIGTRQALRYFQSAERFNAQRALSLGLVHEVVARDQLDASVTQLAQALQQGGPQAQQAAKQLIHDLAHQHITPDTARATASRIAQQRTTPEAREGFAAFLEKRPPSWMVV